MRDGQPKSISPKSTPQRVPPRLVEGEDYRLDSAGRMVFTSAYLRKRGACCGSKCRNCPYGWEFVPAGERIPGEPQPPLDEVEKRQKAE